MFKKISHRLHGLYVCTFAFLISCGHYEEPVARNHPVLELTSQFDKRFTAEELVRVYTDASPATQTAPLENIYSPQNAPEGFKREWPRFTKAVEMKGFINMSQTPTAGEPNDDATARRLVSTLEAFSGWKDMTDKNNKPLFQDAYTTDSSGDKKPDKTDGLINGNSALHYGKIVGSGFPVGLELKFSKLTEGILYADFANPKAISIFPVGTIVNANGIKIHFEFYPYQNGWLYYAVAAPKLEKFEDKASELNQIAESIIYWLYKKVGY